MSRFEINDENQSIISGEFRLGFRWDGERWSHSIGLGEGAIALSFEPDPDQGDPSRIVSPTFQQCHLQETGRGRDALLVGIWGSHHCSGVFHVNEATNGEVTVDADVAVRSRSPLLALASTYRILLTSQALISADADEIAWKIVEPVEGELRFARGSGTRLILAEAGRRETVVQVDTPIDPTLSTQRLTYRWRWRPTN